MDRQHPRDIFDVLGLYAEEGLTPEIVECFVCYLAGHTILHMKSGSRQIRVQQFVGA